MNLVPYCSRKPVGGRPARGFTLTEMMIVVAIIGILGAIAYPAYTEQVQRGKRSQATTTLLDAAQYMQRYYIAQSTFNGADLSSAGLNRAPKDAVDDDVIYDLEVVVPADGRTFTITATPRHSDGKCGSLTLTDIGVKGANADGADAMKCWK